MRSHGSVALCSWLRCQRAWLLQVQGGRGLIELTVALIVTLTLTLTLSLHPTQGGKSHACRTSGSQVQVGPAS